MSNYAKTTFSYEDFNAVYCENSAYITGRKLDNTDIQISDIRKIPLGSKSDKACGIVHLTMILVYEVLDA